MRETRPVTVAGLSRRPSTRMRLSLVATAVVPVGLAIALGAVALSSRSIWLDESATIAISSQHGAALWTGMKRDGGNMLAYYALIHVLIGLFGSSTVVLRMPSVLAGGLTAGAVTAVGTRLFDRTVGFAAGVLTAVSLPLVYWQQDARAYSMMFAFAALSFVGFVALVDGESRRRPGHPPAWAWPAYVVALVLGSYMSLLALLVVPAQLLSLVWYRRRLRQVVLALALTAVCAFPILVLARQRGAGQLFWVPRPDLSTTGAVVESLVSSALPPLFHQTATSLPLLALTLALLVCAAGAALSSRHDGLGGRQADRARFAGVLVAGWVVVPFVLDLAESFVGQSVYQSRYLLISAPAVPLCLAWLLFETRLGRVAGWSGLGALVVLRGLQIAPTYGVSPENWRAATSHVLSRAQAGDCIAFYPSDGRQAFDYYLPGLRSGRPVPRPILPTTPFGLTKPFVEDYATLPADQLAAASRRCRRVWLVSSHVGSSATATSRLHVARFHRLLDGLEHDYRVLGQASFGYASAVDVRLFSRRATTAS